MWMTITSIVMMFGFADLGMSSGLVNLIADSLGRGDRLAAKKASASAFWMLSGIAVLFGLGMAVAYPFLNTSRLFNVHSAVAVRESGPAFLVFYFCFVLNFPLGVARGVQTGLQKGFVYSLWTSLGTIASLSALLLAIHLQAGLPMLVLCLSGPPLLATALNCVELFGWSHPELRPSLFAFSRKAAARLFHTGMMFFLLQLSLTVGMQTDNVVIAQIMGAKAVAAYAVPARMFNVIIVLVGMASGAMWPAYADAAARSDGSWIRSGFIRLVSAGVTISVALAIIVVAFGNRLLAIWVGPQLHASAALLTLFGLQCLLYSYLQPVSTLLSGVGKFRVQVTCAILMAVLNLSLSILFVKHYGILGAVLGTVVSLTVVQVIPMTIVARRTLRGLVSGPASH